MLNSNFHVSLKGLTGAEIVTYSVAILDCETCHASAGQQCTVTEDDRSICRSRFTAAVKQLSRIAAEAVRSEVAIAEGVTITRFEPPKMTSEPADTAPPKDDHQTTYDPFAGYSEPSEDPERQAMLAARHQSNMRTIKDIIGSDD